MAHDIQPLGELEQLILLAIVRLGPDAYGLSIARQLEAQAGRRCRAARSTRRSTGSKPKAVR
jgi:hypothetical protein